MARKETERSISKGRSTSPSISALLAQSGITLPGVDAAGRRAGITGAAGMNSSPAPPSRPPPLARENSRGSSGGKPSPKLSPKNSKLDSSSPVTKSAKSLDSRGSSTQILDKEAKKTTLMNNTVADGSPLARKEELKAPSVKSVKSDKSKKSKKSSSKTKLSDEKSAPFPEGSGDQKIQCNDKKDEKRLEVKIPPER